MLFTGETDTTNQREGIFTGKKSGRLQKKIYQVASKTELKANLNVVLECGLRNRPGSGSRAHD